MPFKLPKNIDTPGRVIRFVLAILLFLIAYWKISWIVLIFAIFVLFESLMSWCVVYHILCKNSCPVKSQK